MLQIRQFFIGEIYLAIICSSTKHSWKMNFFKEKLNSALRENSLKFFKIFKTGKVKRAFRDSSSKYLHPAISRDLHWDRFVFEEKNSENPLEVSKLHSSKINSAISETNWVFSKLAKSWSWSYRWILVWEPYFMKIWKLVFIFHDILKQLTNKKIKAYDEKFESLFITNKI